MGKMAERLAALRDRGVFKLEIPVGSIDYPTRTTIQGYLTVSPPRLPEPLPEDWDWQWMMDKGDYRGTFPKRVGAFYYKKHGITIGDYMLSIIGSAARDGCDERAEYCVDFTQDFSWKAGTFGDSDSCFWRSKATARTMLERNNAWAIRFYDESNNGMARAWLVPDFPREDVLVTFNAYPKNIFKLQRVARLLAYLLGEVDYRQLLLNNNGSWNGTLWINSGNAYLVGNWQSGVRSDIYDLRWSEHIPLYCYACNEDIDDDYQEYDDNRYCLACWDNLFSQCNMCETMTERNTMHTVTVGSGNIHVGEIELCQSCMRVLELVLGCEQCGTVYWNDRLGRCPACDDILTENRYD